METKVVKLVDNEEEHLKKRIEEQKGEIEATKKQIAELSYALVLQEGELYQMIDSQTSDEDEEEETDDVVRFKCPKCGGEDFVLVEYDLWSKTWFSIENGKVVEGEPRTEAGDRYSFTYECDNRNCEYVLPVNRFEDDKFESLEEWIEAGCPEEVKNEAEVL